MMKMNFECFNSVWSCIRICFKIQVIMVTLRQQRKFCFGETFP